MEPTREELIEIIAYALWRGLDLRPKKRSLDDARAWAARVVDHLEACGVSWTKRPAMKAHSTTLR
jgi:hypothetical protein